VLEDVDRDGFAIVEQALAPGELNALTNVVDRTWTELGGGTVHELGFLSHDPLFLELVDHPATLPIVSGLLGWNIYLYHCHLDVHPPVGSAEPRWRWHQDGGRQNLELESPRPRLSVKIAYFLTDVADSDNGCLWVIPGSHRRDTLPRPADGSLRPPGAVPLLVAAGTAVVFDRRLWHARGDNVSEVTRKALFYAYTYRWIRPRDELRLDPELLEAATPMRRQLLGAGTSAIGHWIPTAEDVPLREAIVL
jgi:ectoine hydroxylase